MNKIFHARIVWYHYVILTLLAAAIIWCFSVQNVMVALFMIATVILIEKIIHTTYTVTTDGKLIVYKGRFSKKTIIELKEITSVQAHRSMSFGRFHLSEFVLIRYGNGNYISLEPIKEQEFIELVDKERGNGQHPDKEEAGAK